MERRMSYRLPEKKIDKIKQKLEKEGVKFEDFIGKSIDLYLNGDLDPKKDVKEWGKWMEKK